MSGNDYRIAVLDRTMDLLEALAAAQGPAGVSELAREIGATKSAVFRILANLERRGYVIRDPSGSKYQLGGGLVRLGQQAVRSLDLRAQARPVLEALHQQFNETVNLGVFVNDLVSYVDMIESDHGLRMAAQVGATDEMHSSSLGKSILSYLPEVDRERILSKPLNRHTPRTITDPNILRVELARIRQIGSAEDRGENESGARCVGAPFFNYRGRVMGAVSMSCPESRLNDERMWEIAAAVRAAAADITKRIGGTRPAELEREEAVQAPDQEDPTEEVVVS